MKKRIIACQTTVYIVEIDGQRRLSLFKESADGECCEYIRDEKQDAEFAFSMVLMYNTKTKRDTRYLFVENFTEWRINRSVEQNVY